MGLFYHNFFQLNCVMLLIAVFSDNFSLIYCNTKLIDVLGSHCSSSL